MTSRIRAICRNPLLVPLFSVVLVMAAAGCGGSSWHSLPAQPNPTGITGNWEFTASETSGTMPSPVAVPLGVYLSASNGSVTGSAVPQSAFSTACQGGCCGGPFALFNSSLTGTLGANGQLTLSSTVPGGGPVFTMSAIVNGESLSNGSFTLTGTCAVQGTITGTAYPPLNGTYGGTMTSKDTGDSFTITTTLQQGTAVNARGFLNVNGTATLQGNACMSSATAAMPLEQNSGVLGNVFGVTMDAPQGGATLALAGSLSQDGKTITASYTIGGGGCVLDYGTGTLTLQ